MRLGRCLECCCRTCMFIRFFLLNYRLSGVELFQIGRLSSGAEMAALAGRFSDAEGLIALKDLMNQLGCENVCVEERFPNVGASYVYGFLDFE